MTSRQNTVVLTLIGLLLASGYGVYRTSDSRRESLVSTVRLSRADSAVAVDESSLTTVQQLVALPTTPVERPLAEDALRLADQEMDLAFAVAIRKAAMQPRATTPEARASDARLQQAQKNLAADDAQITQVAAALARAPETERDALTDRLNLARAHAALDQDEVDDAKQDLMRAGGDPQGRMQAMVAEHDAASKRSDSTRVMVTPAVNANGLIRRVGSWQALHDKETQLRLAQAEADSLGNVFTKRHAAIALRAGTDSAAPSGATTSHAASAALLINTQRRADSEKTRSILDQRVDNQRQLADVYGRWVGVIRMGERAVINQMLRDVALILVIVLIGFVADRWIEGALGSMSIDRRRLQTLYIATRVSLQVIGVLCILLVVFGVPDNLGTFIGLAGAGLAVALKDFIVGFFGWFVLMGKNGIRIGDLVEINDVTGEVVEMGMFHTVLLETGSWNDSGHPTGRRVTFINSFAIEGHYFNFSTSGRWLWDEVRIVVPAGRDPRPIIDALQKTLDEATADGARQAEQEWQRARRSPHVGAFTAAPAINVKPIIGGIEITARYITHAGERANLRSALYNTAIQLLADAPTDKPEPTAPERPLSTAERLVPLPVEKVAEP
jgi:small-conductance mechanosensitive channel